MASAEYRQLTAFARVDGVYLSILWTISFACSLIGINGGVMGLIGTALALASPLYAYVRLRKFRDYARDGVISFSRAMVYYVFIFFNASIIFALVQYVYLAFIDKGYLLNAYGAFMSTPEANNMLNAYGMTQQQVLDALSQTSPMIWALNVMSVNVIIGLLLSIPMALIAKKLKVEN